MHRDGEADQQSRPFSLSVRDATLANVLVSAEHLASVPGENLRISQAEFGALWSLAEHLGGQPGPDNDYLVGVLWTCRWLAGQPVWSRMLNRAEIPRAPLTRRRHAAMPETIDEETSRTADGSPWARRPVGATSPRRAMDHLAEWPAPR